MQAKWIGLDKLIEALKNLRRKIFPTAREVLYRAAEEIRQEMAVEGEPPTYPIQWDSDKQRRAYFASDGFGGGIPTVRSGGYGAAWQAIPTELGIDIGNPLSHARYIGGGTSGQGQSRIHRGRWPIFRQVVDRIIGKLPRNIRDRITILARQEGFKTSD